MTVALLVLVAGVTPALVVGVARRHAQGFERNDLVAAVRRHRDFLDGLGAATGRTTGVRGGP